MSDNRKTIDIKTDNELGEVRVADEVVAIIAGLAAKGVTEIEDIFHIERGYEDFEGKLANLGAVIKRVDSDRELQKFKLKIG